MDSSISKRDSYVPLLESSGYSVTKLLGIGVFGDVYECLRSDTKEMVAVKVIPRYQSEIGQNEVHNLEQLREFDVDKMNLIRFHQHFGLSGHIFLEFEKLDMSVLDLFERSNKPFKLSEIQIITQQTLVALNTLRGIGMIHTDIKLDNIMLINHKLHPFKVKLIDFGLACDVKGLCVGDILYIPQYRAPEVYLGLPLNEAVDMWALGCVMVSMYITANLFSGKCELGTVEEIVQLLGQPDDHLLNTGIYTHKYFYRNKDTWKLKSECSCSTGNSSMSSFSSSETTPVHEPLNSMTSKLLTSLKDIVKSRPGVAEYKDTQAFESFIVQILQVDPQKRISPREALRHPFLTLEHFPSDFFNGSSNHEKTAACTEKPSPTSDIAAAAAEAAGDTTATGKDNRPHWLSLAASLDDIVDETSLISVSLVSDGYNTDEGTTGSKVKRWIFNRIHRVASRLFKKGPFANRLDEAPAYSNPKPSLTPILHEAVYDCTNDIPTAAAAGSDYTPSYKKPSPILDEASTICTDNGLTAAADRKTAGRCSDEKPTAILDKAITICTNGGATAAAIDTRPSKEKVSPTALRAISHETGENRRGKASSDDDAVNETSLSSASHISVGNSSSRQNKLFRWINRLISRLFKKGPSSNSFDFSLNPEETAVSKPNQTRAASSTRRAQTAPPCMSRQAANQALADFKRMVL
ncbi:homeodomain-interacting protein kinase 2-like [Solea senegalensis]|uniref:Homeodomain-interacting protein kinase 2-like n=1 Tax=Solea senegalensis TaxID=28829 RepID=A0AAV6PUN9_SOLSE|nr:homeodomain-interacting protein kinase 2-like [Solea senegalensis]